MGELESALDALAADDLHALTAAQLLDRTARWCGPGTGSTPRSPARCGSPTLTQAAEHDGLKTMRSWLRGHARLSRPRRSAGAHRPGARDSCRRWPPPSPTGR